jgi:PAS domain-containing protein
MTPSTAGTGPGAAAPEAAGVLWEAAAQDFRFTFVAAAGERVFGYPAARWIDEPELWAAIIHPDDRDGVVRALRDAARAAGDHSLDYRMRDSHRARGDDRASHGDRAGAGRRSGTGVIQAAGADDSGPALG